MAKRVKNFIPNSSANQVKAKVMGKLKSKSPFPEMTKKELEASMLEVCNVQENFPKIEKLLFKLTNIAPAENTIDSRLRCAFTSANAKSLTKVTPRQMSIVKELIGYQFNLVMCYPMDLLAKNITELTDEEFVEMYKKPDASDAEEIIKTNTIANLESFRAYGRFTREGKKWPDHYDAEYTMCGMADELVEFAQASEEEKSHELGDVLWYFMAICEFWDATDDSIKTIVDAAQSTDLSKDYDYTKAFHKFVKLMRDEPSKVGDFDIITPMMSDVFCTLVKYAGSIDALTEVALENIAKIRDRIARGVVRGSGDNR